MRSRRRTELNRHLFFSHHLQEEEIPSPALLAVPAVAKRSSRNWLAYRVHITLDPSRYWDCLTIPLVAAVSLSHSRPPSPSRLFALQLSLFFCPVTERDPCSPLWRCDVLSHCYSSELEEGRIVSAACTSFAVPELSSYPQLPLLRFELSWTPNRAQPPIVTIPLSRCVITPASTPLLLSPPSFNQAQSLRWSKELHLPNQSSFPPSCRSVSLPQDLFKHHLFSLDLFFFSFPGSRLLTRLEKLISKLHDQKGGGNTAR